jgi:hypothetical protein
MPCCVQSSQKRCGILNGKTGRAGLNVDIGIAIPDRTQDGQG